jgi:glycosyltransferase involved in cell wall biosynthesis
MKGYGAALQRWRQRFRLRNLIDRPAVATALGAAKLLASRLPLPAKLKLALLASGTRRCTNKFLLGQARLALQPWLDQERVATWREQEIGWGRYFGNFGDVAKNRALTTTLLLKEPGPNGEKGVLYSSFEFNWMKLLVNHDARRFFQDYLLVGASSYSPGDHAVLANLCGLSDDPMFIGISNHADMNQYRLFAPHIYPLPIMACDWIDADDYQPRPFRERTIDIVMVAHFARLKRHWILFEALRNLRADLRITLIGRNCDGRTERTIREEAKAFGVRQELTILTNVEIEEVRRHLCNAKVALTLSKREGSCVSVTEALFANTPVVVMDDAHIGAAAYINQQTGRIATRATLPKILDDLVTLPGLCTPRPWALDNISARITSRKLNNILKQYSERSGRPWTRDIAPLCWRYVPRYLDAIDKMRLRPGLERLRQQHGIVLEEFVSEQHAVEKKKVS